MPTVALAMTFETTLLLEPDDVPVPVSATFSTGSGEVRITFDNSIAVVGFTAANWMIRANSQNRVATLSSVPVQPVLSISTIFAGPQVGIDRVTYDPPPFNIESLTGDPVSSFTDFPLTIIP